MWWIITEYKNLPYKIFENDKADYIKVICREEAKNGNKGKD